MISPLASGRIKLPPQRGLQRLVRPRPVNFCRPFTPAPKKRKGFSRQNFTGLRALQTASGRAAVVWPWVALAAGSGGGSVALAVPLCSALSHPYLFFIMVSCVLSFLSEAPAVGFSGSRSASSSPSSLPGQLAAALPSSVSVLVGCQRGVDAAVRAARPAAQVFSASAFSGAGRGAFAARSVGLVRAAASAGGCLVVFPSGPCPAGVQVSRRFSGRGSGSWGSAALALGLGCSVLVCAPFPASGASASWQAWCGALAPRFQVVGGVGSQCWLWAPAPSSLQGSLF
jgi:hypothetical protein